MKNRLIRERYAALTVMSQRVLPSPTAINKVVTLLATRFEQPYHATEMGKKKIIGDHPVPAGWERDTLPHDVAEARQRDMDAFMDESTPVRKIPDRLRLTAADMPKVLKRDGGDANVESLASIRHMLGSLYVMSPEERELDEHLDGEEPDELPDTECAE